MKFSNEQINAINHKDGPVLILAVPGSGKTTVLVNRAKKLVDEGVDPKSILSITFSKSQADDMKKRYENLFGKTDLIFSTIHSFSYSIVRESMRKEGKYPKVIESNSGYNKYSVIRKIFYQVNKRNITDDQLEEFFRIDGYIKNTLSDYKSYKKYEQVKIPKFLEISNRYQTFKKDNELIDFDDMLVLSLNILLEDSDMLNRIRSRYKYIQLDEGQDTSNIQLQIIKLISQPLNNLFIVQDDDQGIYGFRGADPTQLLSFKEIYPTGNIYFMETNYRSKMSIVNVSNKFISRNKKRYKKNIVPVNDSKSKIEIKALSSTKGQLKYIIDHLEKDTAILYRNNISAISVMNALNDNNIEYYIKDSNMAFFNNFILKDIKDIINFSIDRTDFDSFSRIYYKFNAYLKKDFLNQISLMDPNLSIIDRLYECDGINRFYEDKLATLDFILDRIETNDISKQILLVYNSSGYGDYLEEKAKRDGVQYLQYVKIIDTLIDISSNLKTFSDLENKYDELKERQKEASKLTSNLTLSTCHGSKGLEFNNVILIDLIDGIFPNYKADDDINLLEEERRLFYVAMTRAKNKLHLIFPKKIIYEKCGPSKFIDELIK